MDKNETYKKMVYRKNCIAFSKNRGIKAVPKKRLRHCKCKRVDENGFTLMLSKGEQTFKPVLNPNFTYSQSADKIGTFSFIYDEEKPVAVLFVHMDGETFISNDLQIVPILKYEGYRYNLMGIGRVASI